MDNRASNSSISKNRVINSGSGLSPYAVLFDQEAMPGLDSPCIPIDQFDKVKTIKQLFTLLGNDALR